MHSKKKMHSFIKKNIFDKIISQNIQYTYINLN